MALRASLGLLALGFSIEAAGALYFAARPTDLVLAGGVALSSVWIAPVIGLGLLWLGRHEWKRAGVDRFGHVGAALAGAATMGVVAGLLLLWGSGMTPAQQPAWLAQAFGIAAAAGLGFFFVAYGLIAYGFGTLLGKVASVAGAMWAVSAAVLLTVPFTQDFPAILGLINGPDTSVMSFGHTVSSQVSLLALTYLLYAIAFIDAFAHWSLTRRTLLARPAAA
jgi:hypothetical protein